MGYYAGIDIGGTSVKIGLFDINERLIDKWEIPTNKADSGNNILSDVKDSLFAKLHEKGIAKVEVLGVGLGVPGPVTKEGTVLRCINLGWGIFPLEQRAEMIFGLPVAACNDATIATLGEMSHGAGQGCEDVLMVTLGTGVGGGMILDGKVLFGTTGSAGEIGHICVNAEEEVACNCGKKGCLEQYCSATGIVRMAKKGIDQHPNTCLYMKDFTCKDIFDAAANRDAYAMEVVEECCKYLGKALAGVACVVNPERILIGGGVSKAGDLLIQTVQKYFEEYVFHACRHVEFATASLGNDAGIYGAARLAALHVNPQGL